MTINETDGILSDFVRLSREAGADETHPEWHGRVEAKAERLLLELPGEYHDFVKIVCREALERSPVVALMKSTEDEVEPPPVPEEDDISDSDVEPPPSPPTLKAAFSTRLPVRNQTSVSVPHVKLFTGNNGLVHGGTVHIGSSKLVCRAFRFFDRRYVNSRLVRQTDVVAGVCEQFDGTGKLVQRWTTAKRLPLTYLNTSIPLPGYACRYNAQALNVSGFYIGNGHPYQIRVSIKHNKGRIVIDAPENAAPDAHFYASKYGAFFAPTALSPVPAATVENPFYNTAPTGSSGYVVNTPYLSIFSPDPDMPTVIVSMIGAYREGEFTEFADHGVVWTTQVTKFQREASWEVRSFRLQ